MGCLKIVFELYLISYILLSISFSVFLCSDITFSLLVLSAYQGGLLRLSLTHLVCDTYIASLLLSLVVYIKLILSL